MTYYSVCSIRMHHAFGSHGNKKRPESKLMPATLVIIPHALAQRQYETRHLQLWQGTPSNLCELGEGGLVQRFSGPERGQEKSHTNCITSLRGRRGVYDSALTVFGK